MSRAAKPPAAPPATGTAPPSVMWFRKGLRLHDNPALLAALASASARHAALIPVFCVDPHYNHDLVGPIRMRFLLESLADLQSRFRARGSNLVLLRGAAATVLPPALAAWGAHSLFYEEDHEPYSLARDAAVRAAVAGSGMAVTSFHSHTLYVPAAVVAKNGNKVPVSYTSFLKAASATGPPRLPTPDAPLAFPPLPSPALLSAVGAESLWATVPTLTDLGYAPLPPGPSLFPGGETAGLARLDSSLANATWVRSFEKPKGNPAALAPATTVLSPYLKFGCVSPALFHQRLVAIEAGAPGGKHSQPPVSLRGQLLWRDFFVCVGATTPNFDRMAGNPVCRQIPWGSNPALLAAWEEGRTGYPWIDACMAQLRETGWLHHLARHAVACFLTRGDLWQSWEAGAAVFHRLLIDADWALNAGNWMWLSASAFFHQYFRVYSPVSFAQQYDKDGDYIRKWVPALARFPRKYIYEPWKAPIADQKAAGCIIGQDYPKPIVDHASAMRSNMEKMKAAYAAHRAAGGGGEVGERDDDDDTGDGGGGQSAKKGKRKGKEPVASGPMDKFVAKKKK